MLITKLLVVCLVALSLLLPPEALAVCYYHYFLCNNCGGMGIGTCWANQRQINYYGDLVSWRCRLMWMACFSGMQCQWTETEVHSTCDGTGYHYWGYLCCIREY
jgi:hypothetical protein